MGEGQARLRQNGARKVRLELEEDKRTREELVLPAAIWEKLGTQALAALVIFRGEEKHLTTTSYKPELGSA